MLLLHALGLLLATRVIVAESSPDYDKELDDLALYLVSNAIQHEKVFPKAIEVLDKLKTSPSCSRVALQGLITECESIERSSAMELELEAVKEQYAARLAICEVSAAGISPPKECQILVSNDGRSRKTCSSPPCFEKLDRNQIRSCLAALHQENQFWTSFSNSLQNVVHVCQAARVWTEKDDLINVLRDGVRVQGALATRLETYYAEADGFAASVKALQRQVREEFETQVGHTRKVFSALVDTVQSSFDQFLQQVARGTDIANQEATAMLEKFENATLAVAHVEFSMQQLGAETIAIREAINRDLNAWELVDEKAVDLWMRQHAMSEVIARTMDRVTELNAIIHNASVLMSDGSTTLEASIHRFNQTVETIDTQVSAMLSKVSSFMWWSPSAIMQFLQFLITLLFLYQSSGSWASRLILLFTGAGGLLSHVPGFITTMSWSVWRMTISTVCNGHRWIASLSLCIGLANIGILGFVALFRATFVRYRGMWLPRVDVPKELRMRRYDV